MNTKYLSYIIFFALVAVVVGLVISNSSRMRGLISDMAGADSAKRVAAAKQLVKDEQFMDAITGESVPTRVKIVQALEDWGDKDAAKQMVAYLKDPDRPVRDALLVSLTRIASRNADTLQEAVNGIKDGDGNVRKACIAALQALGQNAPAQGMAILKRALPDTPEQALSSALGQRNATVAAQIIPKVVELMKKEAGARGPGGDVLAAFDDQREQCVAALLPLIKDKDEGVRSGAADALGKVGSKTAVPDLIAMMKSDTPQIRRVVIGAIALIADASGEAALTEALGNPNDDNEARAQAASGLGIIGTPSAVATLIKALSDFDLKVQVQAVSALARTGKPAIGPLLEALRAPQAAQRMRAAQALGGIQAAEANSGLLAALKDSDSDVRAAAATALGYKGNAPAVNVLVAVMGGEDGVVARAAADALARIGDEARPALISALAEGKTSAYYASLALVRQGQDAVEAISTGASRSADAARWAAVTLGQIGGPQSVATLKQLVQNPDPETRDVAALSLKRLGVQ